VVHCTTLQKGCQVRPLLSDKQVRELIDILKEQQTLSPQLENLLGRFEDHFMRLEYLDYVARRKNEVS